eukprot:scaffold65042_cov58-Phaeocystis_antarctica.AAC.1
MANQKGPSGSPCVHPSRVRVIRTLQVAHPRSLRPPMCVRAMRRAACAMPRLPSGSDDVDAGVEMRPRSSSGPISTTVQSSRPPPRLGSDHGDAVRV